MKTMSMQQKLELVEVVAVEVVVVVAVVVAAVDKTIPSQKLIPMI